MASFDTVFLLQNEGNICSFLSPFSLCYLTVIMVMNCCNGLVRSGSLFKPIRSPFGPLGLLGPLDPSGLQPNTPQPIWCIDRSQLQPRLLVRLEPKTSPFTSNLSQVLAPLERLIRPDRKLTCLFTYCSFLCLLGLPQRHNKCKNSNDLKKTHKDDDAKVRRAFQTRLTYIGNVAKNPIEEKFRKISLTNKPFSLMTQVWIK